MKKKRNKKGKYKISHKETSNVQYLVLINVYQYTDKRV